jgi:hypothetical protein
MTQTRLLVKWRGLLQACQPLVLLSLPPLILRPAHNTTSFCISLQGCFTGTKVRWQIPVGTKTYTWSHQESVKAKGENTFLLCSLLLTQAHEKGRNHPGNCTGLQIILTGPFFSVLPMKKDQQWLGRKDSFQALFFSESKALRVVDILGLRRTSCLYGQGANTGWSSKLLVEYCAPNKKMLSLSKSSLASHTLHNQTQCLLEYSGPLQDHCMK